MRMDDLDHRILDALQYDFPLSERPYEVLAERLGLDPDTLWQRVEALRERGVIRRVGASFDSKKLGCCSTLAALRVGPAFVGRATRVVGGYREVTHSYLRDHEFNLWFTIIATSDARIETILGEIRRELSLAVADVLNLPMKRMFKLDARFHTQP